MPEITEELIDKIVSIVRQKAQEWDEQPREAGLLPEPTPDPWLQEIAHELRIKGGNDLIVKVYKRVEFKGSLIPRDTGYLIRVWGV